LPNSKRAAIKVVMVAATDHGEGGTTTAAILAATLARSVNSRILLIDANLRTPALEEVFEQGEGCELVGLSDKVLAHAPLDQAIYQTDIGNLFFMPCGRNVTSPSYIFDNGSLTEMLSVLREQFDFVIFDGSPLRDYSESCFLAEKMDGVILVVEAERTKVEAVRKIRKDLEATGVNILGVVLNKKRRYIPEYLERFL
jgi:capsular exopolysaccharide synthesis family protein